MKSDIFGFLIGKFLKQRIIDSLLLFLSCSFLLSTIFSFLYNYLLPHAWILLSAIFLLFLYFTVKISILASKRQYQIEILNAYNPHLRNIIIAAYECESKKVKNSIEKELIEEFEHTDKNLFKFYSSIKRNRNIRILFISMILFFLVLLLFPLHFSNMLSLTEKSAVIEPFEGSVKATGYNLGTIAGSIKIEYKGRVCKFRSDFDYNDSAFLFFSGPAVKSNVLLYGNLIPEKYDSIIIAIVPSRYQKLQPFTEKILNIFVPEYSKITGAVFKNGKADTFFENNKIENNEIKRIMNKYSDSVSVNVIKDDSPAVKMIIEESDLKNKEMILIPCAYIDDYEVESVGIVLKTEIESLNLSFLKASDSLTWFEINLGQINGNAGSIKAFAKDNNPFRRQVSYSQEIYFNKKLDIMEMLSEIDTNEAFSNFSEVSENIMNELNDRKLELQRESAENTMKNYQENLEQIKEAMSELERNLQRTSENNLPDELMKQMFEIKKEIEKIDEGLLSKLMEKAKSMNNASLNKEKMAEILKKDSKEIEDALKQLEKMLEMLNKLSEMEGFKEKLEQISQLQDSVMTGDAGIEQKTVTKEISDEIERNKDSENLKEWSDDMDSLKSMSKEAEKEKKKSEEVKKKLDQLKEDVLKKMNSMSNNLQYDKNQVILTLLSLNEMMTDKNEVLSVYISLLDFTGAKNDSKSPIFLLLQRGINMAEDKNTTLKDMADYNYSLISFLLKKNPATGSGMSMEQMMENLSSISEEQKMLSQTLWEMFNQQSMNGEMMREIGKYQSEISKKLKELGEKGPDGSGLKELSDSLADVAEKIKNGEINEDVLKKQERTLNKMLKLTKSLYKQGINEKRESKPGKDYNDTIKRVMPEDFGFKKSGMEKMMMEFLKEYRDEKNRYYIKKYYMELLK